jgi:hypothetical protein
VKRRSHSTKRQLQTAGPAFGEDIGHRRFTGWRPLPGDKADVAISGVSRVLLARAVSIAGHPAVVLPASAIVTLVAEPPPRSVVVITAATLIVLLAATMGYAFVQVRRRRWGHADAIGPAERRDWNRVSGSALGAGALVSLIARDPVMALGLASATLIVVLAALASSRLKLSQHVAFAILATAITARVDPQLAIIGAALTLAVAWSRLELARHTRAEIVTGCIAGLMGAALFVVGRPFLFSGPG